MRTTTTKRRSIATLATAAAAFDSDDMPANFRLVEHPADS